MQKFELKRIAEISPTTGEELGGALARFATHEEARFRAIETGSVAHWGNVVAQVLYLAAEAYEAGAAASIGHNRSGRYCAAAAGYRIKAEGLEAEAKAVRDAHESKRMLKAFDDGYNGRDLKAYHFETFEAAMLGRLFKAEGREAPKRLNKFYQPRPLGKDSDRDHLLTDLGQKFVVDYPDGRTDSATVTQID